MMFDPSGNITGTAFSSMAASFSGRGRILAESRRADHRRALAGFLPFKRAPAGSPCLAQPLSLHSGSSVETRMRRATVRVLYISEVQWLSQVSRKHLIVRRLPRDWDILFVSPANAARGENSLRLRTDPTQSNVRFVSLPLPKPDSRIPLVRALTGPLSTFGTNRLVNVARSFDPDVLVCSYLWGADAAAELRAGGRPLVYDLNDLHTSFYPDRPLEAEELFRRLLETSDEVVSSSEHLREVAGRGVVIGNGVDLDTFAGRQEVPKPDELARGPLSELDDLVCYVGSVDERIDFGLVEAVGRELDNRDSRSGLLFIGRVFDSVAGEVARVREKLGDRVRFLGRVAYERLPQFMSHTSVGIAPFVLSPRTRAINPNKLYMYAAMDMNVVSTPFSPEIERQGDLVYVASGPDDFASAVGAALRDEDRRRMVRESIALPNSWDEKAREFAGLL
ncbi:MAG: glycosyltransferase, partial [Candidatus Eisenbacteria bacterium]|nr:glycosyltransferase [Candidatus Eisenbacteria bacterium]